MKRFSLDNGNSWIRSDDIWEHEESINSRWGEIINSMDNEVREKVHLECAPCSNTIFLFGYLVYAKNDLVVG